MALLKYLKPIDGLPDPKGSLSASMSSRTIAMANKEVEQVMNKERGKKRGPYNK